MSEFKVGDVVVTVKTDRQSDDWNTGARKHLRWSAVGIITHAHDSHGECYRVEYLDGQSCPYDPWELKHAEQAIRDVTDRLDSRKRD